jgi:hypothetical protein
MGRGEVVFVSPSFLVYKIKIDGVEYLANSRGGIVRVTQ